MQYSRWLALVTVVPGVMPLAGCVDDGTADPEPRDECEEAREPKVLDIELTGLDDTRSYRFVIEAEGARISLPRTPEQRSTFGEDLLPSGGLLVASLDPDTLRVFVDHAARQEGPAELRVSAWSRADLLIDQTFMPAYDHAVPVEGDCFSTITEHLTIPTPE